MQNVNGLPSTPHMTTKSPHKKILIVKIPPRISLIHGVITSRKTIEMFTFLTAKLGLIKKAERIERRITVEILLVSIAPMFGAFFFSSSSSSAKEILWGYSNV